MDGLRHDHVATYPLQKELVWQTNVSTEVYPKRTLNTLLAFDDHLWSFGGATGFDPETLDIRVVTRDLLVLPIGSPRGSPCSACGPGDFVLASCPGGIPAEADTRCAPCGACRPGEELVAACAPGTEAAPGRAAECRAALQQEPAVGARSLLEAYVVAVTR